jgi:hypothetical protein
VLAVVRDSNSYNVTLDSKENTMKLLNGVEIDGRDPVLLSTFRPKPRRIFPPTGIFQKMSSKCSPIFNSRVHLLSPLHQKECTIRINYISTESIRAISVVKAVEEITGLNSVLAVVRDSNSYNVTLDSKSIVGLGD